MSYPLRVLVRYVTTGAQGQVPSQFIKDFIPPRFDKNKIYEVFFSRIATDTPDSVSARAEKVFNIDELIEQAGTAQEKKQLANQPGYYYAKIYAFKETQEEFLAFIGSKEGKEIELKIQEDHKKDTHVITKKTRGPNQKADIAAGSNFSLKRLVGDNSVQTAGTKRVRRKEKNVGNVLVDGNDMVIGNDSEESDEDEVSSNEDSQEGRIIKDVSFFRLKYFKWKAEAMKNVEAKEAAEMLSLEKEKVINHLKRDLQQCQKRLAEKEQNVGHLLSSLSNLAEANRSLSFRISVSSAPNCTQPNVTIQTPQTSPIIQVVNPPSPLSDLITPNSSQTSSISLSLHGSSPLCNSESSFSNTESHPSSSSNSFEVEERNISDIETLYDVPCTPTGIPAANIVPRPLTGNLETPSASNSIPTTKCYNIVSEDRKKSCQNTTKGASGDSKFIYSIITHVYEPSVLVNQYVKSAKSKIPEGGVEMDNDGFKYLESLLEWRILQDKPGLKESDKAEFESRISSLSSYIGVKRAGLRRSLQISESKVEGQPRRKQSKTEESGEKVIIVSDASAAVGSVNKKVIGSETQVNVSRKALSDISNKENEVNAHASGSENRGDLLMAL